MFLCREHDSDQRELRIGQREASRFEIALQRRVLLLEDLGVVRGSAGRCEHQIVPRAADGQVLAEFARELIAKVHHRKRLKAAARGLQFDRVQRQIVQPSRTVQQHRPLFVLGEQLAGRNGFAVTNLDQRIVLRRFAGECR